MENGELVAVFRNPELNDIGGSSYYDVSGDGEAVTVLRQVPDGPEIRHDAVLEDAPRRLKIRWPDVGVLELSARAPGES